MASLRRPWPALIALLASSVSLLGQGWGVREARLPWLQGRFAEAERNFATHHRLPFPSFNAVGTEEPFFCWEAEMAIERGRYGEAAELLREAKRVQTQGSELYQRRMARYLWSVGRLKEAEQMALNKRHWDGRDVGKLRLDSPMALVTIGEVRIAQGRFADATAILEKAARQSKKDWSLNNSEWVRAQIDIAEAHLSLGEVQAAADAADVALDTARQEWGPGGILAVDALDMIGMVRIAQSKPVEANEALSRSASLREQLYGPLHTKIAASYAHGALLLAVTGDTAAAIPLLRKALEIERQLSVSQPNARFSLALLFAADVFERAGFRTEARECYRNAIPTLERELGADAPRVEGARRRYSQ